MAESILAPSAIASNTGWDDDASGIVVTDIDEPSGSPDGALISSGVWGGTYQPEGDVVTLDFPNTHGIVDGDTVSNVSVKVHHREGEATTSSTLDVDLLISGTVQGSAVTFANRQTLTTDTANDVGWNTDWTEAQLDTLQVRLTTAQAGMPTNDVWEVDLVEVVITYTEAATSNALIFNNQGNSL